MKRGDIWLINLDPAVGAEIRKKRPAVIVSSDSLGRLPLRTIVPLTDWKPGFAAATWMIKLHPDEKNQLHKTSAVDCFQPRAISEKRMMEKIGEVGDEALLRIEAGLAAVLQIDAETPIS